MEGKKMDERLSSLIIAEAHISVARKELNAVETSIRCARAILESLADGGEIGADLIASDTTSRSGGSSSGDREA